MRRLEIRRHAMRAEGRPHLSPAGVTLARRIGETLGPFERVITSARPRAIETAMAMGFAVGEQDERLNVLIEGAEGVQLL